MLFISSFTCLSEGALPLLSAVNLSLTYCSVELSFMNFLACALSCNLVFPLNVSISLLTAPPTLFATLLATLYAFSGIFESVVPSLLPSCLPAVAPAITPPNPFPDANPAPAPAAIPAAVNAVLAVNLAALPNVFAVFFNIPFVPPCAFAIFLIPCLNLPGCLVFSALLSPL